MNIANILKGTEKIDNGSLSHALGTARTQLRDFTEQKVDATVINAIHEANAKKWSKELGIKITPEQWCKLLALKSASSTSGKLTEAKENYRKEIDRLTSNLLARLNNIPDDFNPEIAYERLTEIQQSTRELISLMNSYKDTTGLEQKDRTDWRILLSISTYLDKDGIHDKLAIYRGGWEDNSTPNRNQYSNGRPVPHAKSTGYKLKQPLPEYIPSADKVQSEPDNTELDDIETEPNSELE